jgi:hypothetical protein
MWFVVKKNSLTVLTALGIIPIALISLENLSESVDFIDNLETALASESTSTYQSVKLASTNDISQAHCMLSCKYGDFALSKLMFYQYSDNSNYNLYAIAVYDVSDIDEIERTALTSDFTSYLSCVTANGDAAFWNEPFRTLFDGDIMYQLYEYPGGLSEASLETHNSFSGSSVELRMHGLTNNDGNDLSLKGSLSSFASYRDFNELYSLFDIASVEPLPDETAQTL